MSEEKRWIVLGDDGRPVALGRDSVPTEDGNRVWARLGRERRWRLESVTEGLCHTLQENLGIVMVRKIGPSGWFGTIASLQTGSRVSPQDSGIATPNRADGLGRPPYPSTRFYRRTKIIAFLL
jgi:hypothetical protein